MTLTVEDLYNLLPAVYRLRDADQGGVLKELLGVIAGQLSLVEEDIERLYDNWFIETADEWVVPYIGDLLGVRGLHQIAAAGFTQRARVANTLAYRRRKGTVTMLEQLARDTTLWNARAVEFFKLLQTTQYYNHIRLGNTATPDLRKTNILELLDTPFDSLAHSLDVHRIASGRGKHNIPNIGIFLWRLQNYALEGGDPRPADPAVPDGRYFFSSLGYDLPLFNQPHTEATITHLAEERDVPAPIRSLAFYLDLQDYIERYVSVAPDRRPERSDMFGPGSSLDVSVGGQSLSPLQVVCMDLSAWARPPARVSGLISGALPASLTLTSGLSATTPAVSVQIGSDGPHDAVLSTVPTTPAEAGALLEAAIHSSQPGSQAFRNLRIVLVGDRLLLLPGLPGLAIQVNPTGTDATTAGELGMTSTSSATIQAALSTRLKPFPNLTNRRLELTIAANGPRRVEMSAPPISIVDARQKLESAIHTADASPEFQNAQVLVVDDCLLVIPGGAGGQLTFSEAPDDPVTVHLLGLANKVAIDVSRGRLAFPLDDSPADLRVRSNYGFSGDIGGGPYDRRRLRQPGEAELTLYENSVVAYQDFAQVIEVPSGGISTLTAALAAIDATQRQVVIQINDSRTYEEDLSITMSDGDLVIQAANYQRPTLIGDVHVQGTGGGRLALNGLLVAGSLYIDTDTSLRQLDIIHTTLVPGIMLAADGQPLQPNQPSVLANPTNTDLVVNLSESICGPLRLPADCGGLNTRNCIITSPRREQPAQVLPALVSGALPANPGLVGARPELQVAVGSEGPYRVRLSAKPPTRAAARDLLQAALQNASDSLAFTRARVFLSGNRLVLLPGIPAPIRVEQSGADDSAARLRLTPAASQQVYALVGGPVGTLLPASSSPSVEAGVGDGIHTLTLAGSLSTLAAARQSLENALQAADLADPVFASARVLADTVVQRLIVLPGAPDTALQIYPTTGDSTTAIELALVSDIFPLAGSPAGELPGPQASLERTTVLGCTHLKELLLASECMFTGLVMSDRRQGRGQQDCVRFSFVPFGSRTPRRFRCQPDLAIQTAIAAEEERLGHRLNAVGRSTQRQQVLERLLPSFTSTQYGQPAFAQLGSACPVEIKTGAADGADMGVFSFLKQPQREANLQASLDEYLRFGLEAGIFYVS